MSGHSHWAGIKHKKAANDAKRGKVWSKIARMIIVAAKAGGGDPGQNLTLRYAIDKGKGANMPKDTIEKAIKKGTGEIEGVIYEECSYEGYGPGGVAILLEVMTDNKNRTLPEIRTAMSKNCGNMGESGSVAWMFDRKGMIIINAADSTEDDLMELTQEAGADDIVTEGELFEIYTDQNAFEDVRDTIEGAGINIVSAEITMKPQN
ncbi:MAG: YebC/PmpR family DNA-binding transcriptional regulator, partial [Planctomycetes bacterium]|nr:YebC/PmpR family DNA-binding transcriptional regulator [Planctomycetota bacterium]